MPEGVRLSLFNTCKKSRKWSYNVPFNALYVHGFQFHIRVVLHFINNNKCFYLFYVHKDRLLLNCVEFEFIRDGFFIYNNSFLIYYVAVSLPIYIICTWINKKHYASCLQMFKLIHCCWLQTIIIVLH